MSKKLRKSVPPSRAPITLRYKEFDVAIGALFKKARAEGHTIPCSRGCDACCYDAAYSTHLEMPPMVETLRAMAVEKRVAIKRRLLEWFAKMQAAGLSPADTETTNRAAYYRAHLACPLLDQDKHECSVYSVRPIACRAHHVVDATPEVCAGVAAQPSTPCLLVHELTNPFLQQLLYDQQVPPGVTLKVAMSLLPAMVWAAWHLVEHPELSIDEWVERVGRDGAQLSPPAKQ